MQSEQQQLLAAAKDPGFEKPLVKLASLIRGKTSSVLQYTAHQVGRVRVHRLTKKAKSQRKQKKIAKTWQQRGWPTAMLQQDPEGAALLQLNLIPQAMRFYGHAWPLNPENGDVLVPVEAPEGQTVLVPWKHVKPLLHTVPGSGWPIFDGMYYGPHGFSGIDIFDTQKPSQQSTSDHHRWHWNQMPVAYRYNEQQRPDFAYLDIIVCNYESCGLPGFGFMGQAHGHVYLELCDAQGYVFSVGQYPEPSTMNVPQRAAVFRSVRAALFSPDIFMYTHGERSVHRWYLGNRELRGQHNFELVRGFIENIQRCGLIHNGMTANCVDFALVVEEFVRQKCDGAYVMDLQRLAVDGQAPLLPMRRFLPFDKRSHQSIHRVSRKAHLIAQKQLERSFHRATLRAMSIVMTTLANTPYVGTSMGQGFGIVEDSEITNDQHVAQTDQNDANVEHGGLFAVQRYKYFRPHWPRWLRIRQQYGQKLAGKSAIFRT